MFSAFLAEKDEKKFISFLFLPVFFLLFDGRKEGISETPLRHPPFPDIGKHILFLVGA
jgi:hypothetical protein